MQNKTNKTETSPPSYASVAGDDTASPSISSGLDQFVRIVGNHAKLHFHAPDGMGWCTVPETVQIRDSRERPILCVMTGRMIAAGRQNRVVSSREIMTPSGEALISISPGSVQILSSGDHVLGKLEDDKLLCRQTLKAKNVMGDIIFEGAGEYNIGDSGCGCCVECGFGYCSPNSTKFYFSHRGVTLGQFTRSESNSSGNELELFNWANIDPSTKAILIYASYCAVSDYIVDVCPFFYEIYFVSVFDVLCGRKLWQDR